MDLILAREFMKKIMTSEQRHYMMNMITYNISPTLKGAKPATVITLSNNNKGLYEAWLKYGKEYLETVEIEAFELVHSADTVIILFYYKEILDNHLNKNENKSFLNSLGYDLHMTLHEKLNLLRQRYVKYQCPHEIGLFLGIPLKDVLGFLRWQGMDYLACGYWKVYENKEQALNTFKSYDSCKVEFAKLYLEGVDLWSSVRYINLTTDKTEFL